ncbi:hypothetical protein J437_LFUL009532 [Ladona fulva]|uniref:Endonuclease/exonuclease/phosphatase domain-containing protein n=1 Tax=Ladona fulva TaxID=123851 RepID=A0A8K0K7J2_LADFU|nr:hypothetical protein J437_LFUL009532 [Ladona fulva]
MSPLNQELIFECAAISFKFGDDKCYIIGLYRSPLACFTSFCDKFDNILSTLLNQATMPSVFITGDCNVNFLHTGTNLTNVMNIFSSVNMISLINKPTRESPTSLLDNIFTNYDISSINTSVFDPLLSDHFAVLSRITYNVIYPNLFSQLTRIFSKPKFHIFSHLLQCEDWSPIYNAKSFNNNFNLFYHKFLYFFNTTFPLVNVNSIHKPGNKCIKPDIHELSREIKNFHLVIEMLTSTNDILISRDSIDISSNLGRKPLMIP